MLKQVAEGMNTLQKHKIDHECLTTKTILVEGPTHFRVVDPITVPVNQNLDVVYHKRNIKNVYLSPEQCQRVDLQEIGKGISSPSKSDVFTFGMILLEAGLLRQQDECYEDDCARINWRQIEHNIGLFTELYGQEFKRVLEKMLRLHTIDRIDWQGLVR